MSAYTFHCQVEQLEAERKKEKERMRRRAGPANEPAAFDPLARFGGGD